MSFAITYARTALGIDAPLVSVEVHLTFGLPNFIIVGLPETAVKESKDRVRSAIINSQFEFPVSRIVVNLAPADLPKTGSGFDLAIALGILAASHQIPETHLAYHEFMGELSLDGYLRAVSGIIPIAMASKKSGRTLIIPKANELEAALTELEHIYVAKSLKEVCHYFCQHQALSSLPPPQPDEDDHHAIDWSDVKGQAFAKHAFEVAACGGHSILLSGVPGSGKTMLAKRFSSILPELTPEKALEVAALYSINGSLQIIKNWRKPPFRAPHHTASQVALVGGGNPPKPGEISLAHQGVLFLDELPEFHRHVLETLREPLESGQIAISRAKLKVEYPAEFQLIAAMNPCPCGHYGNPLQSCVCSPDKINRYLNKLSGPLMERIDMHIFVHALSATELLAPNSNEPKESFKKRQWVKEIRLVQFERQGCLNAHLSAKAAEEGAGLGGEEANFIALAMTQLKLSARAYHRWLKVSRTLADIELKPLVELKHLQQALSFKHTLKGPNTGR